MMDEGLPKSQRLYKIKAVKTLFDKGKGFSSYPFRVIVLLHETTDNEPHQSRFLISVSKKRFHHAVKRNKVKRLVREAWRRNKSSLNSLCELHNKTFDIALVYTATIILPYNEIEKKIKQLVLRLQNDYLNYEEDHTTAG